MDIDVPNGGIRNDGIRNSGGIGNDGIGNDGIGGGRRAFGGRRASARRGGAARGTAEPGEAGRSRVEPAGSIYGTSPRGGRGGRGAEAGLAGRRRLGGGAAPPQLLERLCHMNAPQRPLVVNSPRKTSQLTRHLGVQGLFNACPNRTDVIYIYIYI